MSALVKFFVKLYIRKCAQNACNGNPYHLHLLLKDICAETRAADSESNDSTIYAFLVDELALASKTPLRHVSEALRPDSSLYSAAFDNFRRVA
jgi:hypothetical protein